MFSAEMLELIEAHTACQLGCYFSEITGALKGNQYLYSKQIPDTGWNFCIPASTDEGCIQWGVEHAQKFGRQPAFFVSSHAANDFPSNAQRAPEHWMVRTDQASMELACPNFVTEVREIIEADPGVDFASVFSNLFADDSVNSHFRSYYVPTLRAARRASKAQPLHLVAYAESTPVACASLYSVDKYAGLYNVGATNAFQRRGLGAWISAEILNRAEDRQVFLQCETGTHVEKMYCDLGFQVYETPEIVTLA